MRLLIQNGYILSLDSQDRVFERGDIFIDGTKIIKISKSLDAAELNPDRVIDASDKLVVPGLVNADLHAVELLSKGLFENRPLELRVSDNDTNADFNQLTSEMVYITTFLSGIQALKTGVTTVQDHWRFSPTLAKEDSAAVLDAYNQIGLRTNLALEIDTVGLPWKLSHLNDDPQAAILPIDDRESNIENIYQIINAFEEILSDVQKIDGDRLKLVVAPPQWLLGNTHFVKWLADISGSENIAIHFHFNQTKWQVLNAMKLFQGKTAIEHAARLGLLTPQTSISHAIWITPSEIELLANSGVTVIHTPISDLYTGSGVVPLHLLIEAGVNIGLGSGESCGGNQTLLNTMKMTASIHRVVQPDYNRWVSVEQTLSMATHGSARACLLEEQIGQIAVGCKADLVLYNLKGFSFSPLNNPKDQLVCLEQGSSVDTVLVDGKVVVERGEVIGFNEADLLHQFRRQYQLWKATLDNRKSRNALLEASLEDTYCKCVSEPMQINRWADNGVFDSCLQTAFLKKGK